MIRTVSLVLATLCLPVAMATAQEHVLIDYRDPAVLNDFPTYQPAESERLKAALETAFPEVAADLPDDFTIIGDAEGAFTASGVEERVYLVQAGAPVAIEPFPEASAPILIVMDGEEAAAAYRLSEEVQYQRVAAAADVDGDGRDEVLLETAFFNMGQSVVSLDVVALSGDGDATMSETLSEVYADSCENPVGDRSRVASVISLSADGIGAEPHEEPCP